MAHVAVWTVFLFAGPFLGVIVGIKRLRETDPIVNGVQAGGLARLAGFVGALSLLAPAYVTQSKEAMGYVVFFGSQAAFIAGGLLGFFIGICRLLVFFIKRNGKLAPPTAHNNG